MMSLTRSSVRSGASTAQAALAPIQPAPKTVKPITNSPRARIPLSSSFDGCSSSPGSRCFLGFEQLLRDGHPLHIAGPLVNPSDLGVPIELLHGIISGEPD